MPNKTSSPKMGVMKDIESYGYNHELISNFSIVGDIILCDRILSDLEMILQGAFNPLKGFMTLEEYMSVVYHMELPDKSVFPIPVVLPLSLERLRERDSGTPDRVCLKDSNGTVVAVVNVASIYIPDIKKEQQEVLNTNDNTHPWVQYQEQLQANGPVVYIGGIVEVVGKGIRHYDFSKLRKSATEMCRDIKERGLKTVVGFQTRNPMHRAHFELTVQALREVSTPEEPATLMITPAVGPTQPGDISAEIRVHCYEAILPYYKAFEQLPTPDLVLLPLQMRMAGPREAVFHAIIRRNYGCTHFIVGRDHAGPSSRRLDGSPFYGCYAAHDLVSRVEHKLGIKCILGKMMVYSENKFVAIDKVKKNAKVFSVSGTEFRKMLEDCEPIPHYYSFVQVVDLLKQHFRPRSERGLCVYFTGLPCSGKSTLAAALQARLGARCGEARRITVLDGDAVRLHLSKGLGFSAADRSLNVRRIGYVASEITKHGGIAISANIAPFKADREHNRGIIEKYGATYVEVYVNTPLEVCENRDVKNMYAMARKGIIKNFTGVSDPYEAPTNPDIVVDTLEDIGDTLATIESYLEEYKLVP